MGYEVWLLCQMEFRRYLRSRRFWRILMTTVGLVAVTTLLLGLLILGLPERAQDTLRSYVHLFDIMWCFWSVIYVGAVSLLVREVFSDSYRTRPLADLYLLPVHPLSIVWGRLLTVGLQVGLMLLLGFPSALFVGWFVGMAWWEVGTVVLWSWLSLMGVGAVIAFGLRKWFPESFGNGLVVNRSQAQASWLISSMGIALFLLFIVNASTGGRPLSLPLGFLFPMTVPQVLWAGGWSWLWGLLLWGTVFFAVTISTAQLLGWWSDLVFARMRILGTVAFWFWLTFNLTVLAELFVNSPLDAEICIHRSMGLGSLFIVAIILPLLGYYAIGRRADTSQMRVSPVVRGLMLEWVLIAGWGLLAWLAIGYGSGFWVAWDAWLARLAYLLAMLAFAQAVYGVRHLWNYYYLKNYRSQTSVPFTVEYRLWLVGYSTYLYSAIFWLWFSRWLMGLVGGIVKISLDGVWGQVADTLVWLHPFNGWFKTLNPATWYWQYAGYVVVLAILLWGYGAYRMLRWLRQSVGAVEAESSVGAVEAES